MIPDRPAHSAPCRTMDGETWPTSRLACSLGASCSGSVSAGTSCAPRSMRGAGAGAPSRCSRRAPGRSPGSNACGSPSCTRLRVRWSADSRPRRCTDCATGSATTSRSWSTTSSRSNRSRASSSSGADDLSRTGGHPALCPCAGSSRPSCSSPATRRTDCEWDLPNGTVVVLEVDGAFHMAIENYTADMRRQRRITTHQLGSCAQVGVRAPTSAHDLTGRGRRGGHRRRRGPGRCSPSR